MSDDDMKLYQVRPPHSTAATAKVTPDRIIAGLEASSNLSAATGHPGQGIRPCLAQLLETKVYKGDMPDRNSSAVALASELHRIGQSAQQVKSRLILWNEKNEPPLNPNNLERAIQSGCSDKYRYGCNHLILKAFCLGEDTCPFFQYVRSPHKKTRNHVFLDYGWQHLLTNRQVLIYFAAIPYLEVKRQVGPGGVVCANHKQIAGVCGVSEKRMGIDLGVLREVGLIDYKPGSPQKWRGIASTIRRVMPIPRPSTDVSRRLRNR